MDERYNTNSQKIVKKQKSIKRNYIKKILHCIRWHFIRKDLWNTEGKHLFSNSRASQFLVPTVKTTERYSIIFKNQEKNPHLKKLKLTGRCIKIHKYEWANPA